jgi:hypothetical protein
MKIFWIRKPAFSVEYKVGKVSNVWVWFQPGMAWSIASFFRTLSSLKQEIIRHQGEGKESRVKKPGQQSEANS